MTTLAMTTCMHRTAAHSSVATQQRCRLLAPVAVPLRHACFRQQARQPALRQLRVQAEGSDERQSITQQEDDELPPWLRKEKMQKLVDAEGGDLPFGLYLLASSLVAIAAVGSIFEIINQNPVFGVVQPDSPLYLPILGFFAVTGFPTTGWLFLKGVKSANDMAERMDRIDGK